MKAAEVYGLDATKSPMASWRESSRMEAKLCLALALAINGPSEADKEEIQRRMDEVLDSEIPGFIVLGLDVPCVLGDRALWEKMIARAAKSQEVLQDTLWVLKILDYHTGTLDEEEWLSYAAPFSQELCLAHHVIGMKALLDGDGDKAAVNFEKATEQAVVGHWAFHSSRLYSKKLKNGWIPPAVRLRSVQK